MDKDNTVWLIEHCVNDGFCSECKYKKDLACKHFLLRDALALLKEQEERIKTLEHQLETITKWRANAGAFD